MQFVSTQSDYDRPDYPALYKAANNASIKSQKDYLRTMKWYLGLTIVGAFFSLYIKESTEAGIIAAIIFFAILSLTVFLAYKRFDKIWYNGRAVAESVKTITWRFIMRAEPYYDNEDIDKVKKEFCEDLKKILNQNKELAEYFAHESMKGDSITEKMLKIRYMDFEERLNYYLSNRINEQRTWYYTKASTNKKKSKNWFIGLVVTHIVIIVLLLISIGYDIYNLPTTGLIVLSGSILSWIQIKRFQDLSTSYSLTAHEIGIIKEQYFQVINEKTLSDFVKEAENAFSREHTQWVARKDK